MSKPAYPPRGVFIPTEVAFHQQMQPRVRDTLIQLIGLSWANGGRFTPYVSYAELSHLTGKSVSTLREHISILRNDYQALCSQSAGNGTFCFVFSAWVVPPSKRQPREPKRKRLSDSENSCREDLKEVNEVKRVKDFKELKEEQLPSFFKLNFNLKAAKAAKMPAKSGAQPPEEAHLAGPAPDETPPAAGLSRTAGLPPELRQVLLEAGVYESLLGEVASSGLSEGQIRALLDWTREDEPLRPAGLFISRLRRHILAPEKYSTPACRRCGQRLGHAKDCPERYSDNPYARHLENG
jgi:hypothetical protein